MGLSFRRSKKVGPFRLTLSHRGLSGSVGASGLRYQLFGPSRRSKSDASNGTGQGCAAVLLLMVILAAVSAIFRAAGLGEDPQAVAPSVLAVDVQPMDQPTADEQGASVGEEVSMSIAEPPVSEPEPAAASIPIDNQPPEPAEPARPVSKSPLELYRTWSTPNGKSSVQARLVDTDGANSLLFRRNPDKLITVPIDKISAADRQYINDNKYQLVVGQATIITDGDSLTIFTLEGQYYPVRLNSVDAPEMSQPYGSDARARLVKLVNGKLVRVRWAERDQYERVLGDVILDGKWINLEMVNEGLAWHFKKYSDDPAFDAAEKAAREKKLGLWRDYRTPVPPWTFRDRGKNSVVPPSESTTTPLIYTEPKPASARSQPAKSYWLNTGTGVRHNRSCQNFGSTKTGRPCGPGEGKACGICGG